MKLYFRICCASIAMALSQATLSAQSTSAPAAQSDLDKLTLHPSAATQPWTQNRLMMPSGDQQEGNAVPLYLIAAGPNGNDTGWTKRFFARWADGARAPIQGWAPHYYCGTTGHALKFTTDQWYEQLHKAKLPIDVINGGPELKAWVDDPTSEPGDLDALTAPDEAAWAQERRSYLRY